MRHASNGAGEFGQGGCFCERRLCYSLLAKRSGPWGSVGSRDGVYRLHNDGHHFLDGHFVGSELSDHHGDSTSRVVAAGSHFSSWCYFNRDQPFCFGS